MLSTENPPVDLSCSSSSPGIGQIVSDEKGNNHSNQQLQPNLDLLQPSLDENKRQVQNFSIRDYVFTSRGKDIKTHWPFSPKNLHLCLKYGVSNVLPPFQTPYSVRNPSAVDSQAQELPVVATIATSNEVVRTTQNPGKSCKLTAKPTAEPKASKESMKTTSVADTMASKVCPVCKTFSSSSNTTLNAHIDQCLSGGPVSNPTAKSNVIKHRIKPRKIRLMVDIYETALRCTLEDLDRRNGTNWASSSNPAKDSEATLSTPSSDNEEDNEIFSSVNAADKDEDGAVYVDSTGTKLRILSKSSDLRANAKSTDDHGPKKTLVKRDKSHNFFSSKKKYLLQNRKLLKASSHAKVPENCPKAKNFEQGNVSSREGFERRDQRPPLNLCGRMKSADLGIVKRWVGSKRTVPKKKNNLEHERRRLHKATMENFRGTKRLSPLSSNHELDKGANDSTSPRTEKNHHGKKSHLSLPKRKDSSKDATSEHKRRSRDHTSSIDDEEIRENLSPVVRRSRYQAFSSENIGFASRKSPSLDHEILPHGKKLSSSKKNVQSDIKHASVSGSKRSTETKHLGLKKRRLRYASESDEEYIVPRSAIRRQDKLLDETQPGEDALPSGRAFSVPSNDRFKDLKVQNNELEYANSGVKISIPSIGRCTLNTEAAVEEVEGPDLIALDKYLDSPLPPYDECLPQHYVKAGDVVNTGSGLGTFHKKHLVITEANAVMDIDKNERERDYYGNIDPIPIPGPPGSFLPSPGRRGSDELQGRSSLTSCNKIHSEDDEREVIDMDSSDSPISAASNISNSIVDGSDLATVIDPSRHLSGVHDKIQSDFLKNDKIHRAAAEGSTQFDSKREEQHRESRAATILSDMSPHGLFKNRPPPCSCSRKDGAYRSNFLDYRDPQLVGQRTMNSISLHPSRERQTDWNVSCNPDSFNSGLEVPNVRMKHSSEPNEVITNFSEVPRSCHELPSPSAPNPVLRLMGKNLMVVNKEANFSPERRPTPPQAAADGHLYTRSFSDKGLFDKNWQSSYSNTVLRQGPSVLDDRSETAIHAVEYGARDGFRVNGGFSKPELFPQKSFNGSFAWLGPAREPEKVTQPVELIVIDGSPRNETGQAAINHRVESVHSTPLNPFYMYSTHDHTLSRAAHNTSQNSYYTQVPYSMGKMQENVEKWKSAAENSRMLSSQNSFTASSSLPGRAGSSPYTSHGFPSDENFS